MAYIYRLSVTVRQEPEYGCYALYNKGELCGFELFESAASCLVYRQLPKHYTAVKELCKDLGKTMNLTGQLTLDLMFKGKDLVPIECNPRLAASGTLALMAGSTVPCAPWKATRTWPRPLRIQTGCRRATRRMDLDIRACPPACMVRM